MIPCTKCGATDRYTSGACRPCNKRTRAARRARQPRKLNLRYVRLDFQPIYEACQRLRDRYNSINTDSSERIPWTVPQKYRAIYEHGVRSGTINVVQADAFCCDVLEVNPVCIYGWEFLTVGEEEDAA